MKMVKENIRSAVTLAKEAVKESKKEVFIAGDIGPIPDISLADEQYYEIAKTFWKKESRY